MSLLPLSKVQCDLPRRRKYPIDVHGTANVSYGHKLREPETRYIAKYHGSRSIFDGANEQSEKDKREYEQFLKTLEFEKKTNRKIRNEQLRQRAQRDMSVYEENLQARREKLRDLVLNEEANLTKEIVEEAQRGNNARLEETRAKTEELRKRRDEEHEAVVAAKRMQQYLASCPDVKQALSKRAAIDAKRCNVAQMAENETKRSAETQLDALWHKVMLTELETKKHEETDESVRRASAQRETASALARQVADKLTLEDERKLIKRDEREHVERLWDEVRRTERKNLETERQKRETLKKELEEQILTAKRKLAERARAEAAVDRESRTFAEKELAVEKARGREDVVALRAELLARLKYLEDLRQEEARRNAEVEAICRQSHEDAEARRRLALKKFKEAREREMQEFLRGREEQLRAKREAQEEERRLKMEEKEAVERQIEMNANLAAIEQEKIRQRTLRYRLDLQEQRQQARATRDRELEESRRQRSAGTGGRADEYQRLTDELLNASENITPHPFKVLLQQCAARHAAESKGRSYCPPALTSAQLVPGR